MTFREFIPREHGAWAMWIVPMLSAATITRFSLSFFVLFVCFTLFYIVHHPVVKMIRLRSLSKQDDMRQVAAVALPAVLLGIALVVFDGLVWLLLFGAAEAAIFALSVRTFLDKEQRSILNELTVVASLTLSAPAAYYTITGTLDHKAVLLYVLNFLFFGSSIFYVKMKIEFLRCKGVWIEKANRSRLIMIAYHLLLIVIIVVCGAAGILSPWILLGFAPMLVQVAAGTLSKQTRINFTSLGVMLVVQSAVFLTAVGLLVR